VLSESVTVEETWFRSNTAHAPNTLYVIEISTTELEDLINKIKTRLHLRPEAEEFLYSISNEKTKL
jgi:hypothetical protein